MEIIKSISELDNSVVSFNHGMVETIPPGKKKSHKVVLDNIQNLIFSLVSVRLWHFKDGGS